MAAHELRTTIWGCAFSVRADWDRPMCEIEERFVSGKDPAPWRRSRTLVRDFVSPSAALRARMIELTDAENRGDCLDAIEIAVSQAQVQPAPGYRPRGGQSGSSDANQFGLLLSFALIIGLGALAYWLGALPG